MASLKLFGTCRSLAGVRSYATAKDRSKRYTFNYQQLKGSGLLSAGSKTSDLLAESAPVTVSANVKNVQGYKGGAERGFLGSYPDCIHQIVTECESIKEWFTKVLTHNLSTNVLGVTRFGMLVPITFYQLQLSKGDKESMKNAHVLGWSVELIRAHQMVAASTLKFRGHRHLLSHAEHPVDNSWNEKHNLGDRAFSDALLLQNAAFTLIHMNLSEHVSYPQILSAVCETLSSINYGRALTLKIASMDTLRERMAYLNASSYKRIIHQEMNYTRYVLPVRLALHLAEFNGSRMHDQASKVLSDIGFLVEVTGDFADCYVMEHGGTDIQEGRMTWLLVNAYHRANAAQKAVLESNYGVDDAGKVALVKQVYEDLKLKKMVSTDIERHRQEMQEKFQQIYNLSQDTLPSKFFFQLLDDMSHMA